MAQKFRLLEMKGARSSFHVATVLEVWAPSDLEAGLTLRLGTGSGGPHGAQLSR